MSAAITVPGPVDLPDLRDTSADESSSRYSWPAKSPIVPLGISGSRIVFLDRSNQLIDTTTECRKNEMVLWIGDGWLTDQFPQFGKPDTKGAMPPIVGFDQKHSSVALIEACQAKGIFNPQGRVFGRGAHRLKSDNAALVLHMGTRLLIVRAAQPPKRGRPARHVDLVDTRAGAYDACYYPAAAALPAPAIEASGRDDGEALLTLLKSWYWDDDEVGPLLVTGMIGAMFVCGALDWRPHIWLTGPTAAGKSYLQKLIRTILGDWCLHSEDSSEAAVRQLLGEDTLAVLIDEAESDDNPERQKAMVNLARKASSGAKILRGTSDHKGQQFTAQSCFLFSSILHSPLQGQDRNRIAILEMHQVPGGTAPLDIDWSEWRVAGRRMHRRVLEQWPRFERTLGCFKREIGKLGFAGRWMDTYGTLLAFADLLLHDCAPCDDSELNESHGRDQRWVRAILPMMMRARSEARTDVERCIHYLLSTLLPSASGQHQEPVAAWIERGMRIDAVDDHGTSFGATEKAQDKLKSMGLRLARMERIADDNNGQTRWKYHDPLPEDYTHTYVMVAAATNRALHDLFRGSEWSGGGWWQSLGKVEGAIRGLKCRFSSKGAAENAIAVPLKAMMQGDER